MKPETAALQLAISSLSDEALIILLKNKCDWSTRISFEKYAPDEEEKLVRTIVIKPENTAVFLYISYYFKEIVWGIYKTFGHSCISCSTKEPKFIPDWTWEYSRKESIRFQVDQVTYWALIDYDFDQALIFPYDCMYNRESLKEYSQGINKRNPK